MMLEIADVLEKIRLLEIQTRKWMNRHIAGEHQSRLKGRGIVFSDLRPYQEGDEVRLIDWKATAKLGDPFIKQFEQERELQVVLAVDCSASTHFLSDQYTKQEKAIEIAASLGFSAIKQQDQVSLVLFTDQIEHVVPLAKGESHMMRIIKDMLAFNPISKKTRLSTAMAQILSLHQKRSIVFLISDFCDSNFEKEMTLLSKHHDLIPIHLSDPKEKELPNVGLIHFKDSETGEHIDIDTASEQTRNEYKALSLAKDLELKRLFHRLNVPFISLNTDQDYVLALLAYFKATEKVG